MGERGIRPSNSAPIAYIALMAEGRRPILSSELRRVSIVEELEGSSPLSSLLFSALSGFGLLGARTTWSSNKEENMPEAMMGTMRD